MGTCANRGVGLSLAILSCLVCLKVYTCIVPNQPSVTSETTWTPSSKKPKYKFELIGALTSISLNWQKFTTITPFKNGALQKKSIIVLVSIVSYK